MFDRKSQMIYMHIADLLYPFEGKPTQEQLLIASRSLDIKDYKKSGGGGTASHGKKG